MRSLLAALVFALSAAAGAQPHRERPEPPPDPAFDAPAHDAGPLRERIRARLEQTVAQEGALRDALAALDRGEDPRTVAQDLFRRAHDEREPGPPPREVTLDELTPEKRQEILAFVREVMPQLGARVDRELDENPDRADEIFLRLAPRVLPQIELRAKDPEMFDLRAESMRLDWRIRQAALRAHEAPDADREVAVDALRALVGERIDLTLRERALMIDRFEARLAEMRAELETDRANRDALVNEKVRELERPAPRGERPRRRDDAPQRREPRPRP